MKLIEREKKQDKILIDKKISILLVEDDEDDYRLIHSALGSSIGDYSLTWVKNGKEALRFLDNCFLGKIENQLPDIILLDLYMPLFDGYEFLEKVRGDYAFSDILLIALSSSKSPVDLMLSYDYGVDSYLVKASHFDEMVDDFNSLIHYWFKTVKRPLVPKY